MPPARESGQCVEAGKGKETESSWSLQKEPALQHLDFSPLRSTSVFLPPEVQDNQSVFFYALKFTAVVTEVKNKQTNKQTNQVSGNDRAVQNLAVPPRHGPYTPSAPLVDA